MRKSMKTLAATSALVVGLAVAPALYAHDSGDSGESGESGESMMGSGMRGQGGMMNMMGMMRQMSEMMENCNEMMRSMHGDRKHQNAPENGGRLDGNG